MSDDVAEIRWTPRVTKQQIHRLYESDARSLLDEKLLGDVGTQLCMRCENILAVAEARGGKIRCPRCAKLDKTTVIQRARGKRPEDETVKCPQCSWETTWKAYQKTFQRKQLNDGGAGNEFRSFIERYGRARTPTDKMLAVDQVIHAFHVHLIKHLETGAYHKFPARAACVNLIEGKVTDVVAFLDQLTYGDQAHPRLKEMQKAWRKSVQESREVWDDHGTVWGSVKAVDKEEQK